MYFVSSIFFIQTLQLALLCTGLAFKLLSINKFEKKRKRYYFYCEIVDRVCSQSTNVLCTVSKVDMLSCVATVLQFFMSRMYLSRILLNFVNSLHFTCVNDFRKIDFAVKKAVLSVLFTGNRTGKSLKQNSVPQRLPL